ncbi:response regulator transcription factor [Paenibacillus agaridevorans]|uniref:response regulator transcription factor n=1 Tax=Paenibacillus agaridevorans TaxID=171404 RepID=UPI001FE962FA|nr:response regulator [Paenibacillus agaridevorans]
MIQALIVDDEPTHIQGLVRHVGWEAIGYAPPLTAQSGEAALALLRNHDVDVLISDVSMPIMTGIELVSRCKELGYRLQVLIISGYNEFEFVQEAIHVGAQAYVLKPIKTEEVEAKLTAFRAAIEKQRDIEAETNELQEKVSGSLDVVKERFVHDLVLEGLADDDTKESWIKLLELPPLMRGISVISFGYDRFMDGGRDAKSRIVRGSGFLKAVKVSLADFPGVIAASMGSEEVVAVHLNPLPEEQVRMEKGIAFVQQWIREQYGSSVTVGLSRIFKDWGEAPIAYKRVKYMMAKARLLEGGQVLYEERLDETEFLEHRVREEYIPEIVRMLEKADEAGKAVEYTSSVLDMLIAHHPFTYIQAFGLGLLSELARKRKLQDDAMADLNIPVWQRLIDCTTVPQVKDVVMEYVKRYAEAEQNKQSSQQHNLIQKISDYIEAHIHENVTVKQLAELHHLNASYLSVLFKKSTGKTVSEFVQETRMNKAMELLRDPHVRVYEVAEQVGFQTAAYFTYLFKKTTGYTPQEYRDYH